MPQVPQSKKGRRFLMIVVIVALASFLLGVGGYFVWQYFYAHPNPAVEENVL